jgi:alpha-ribazole phosphatase
VEIYLIRHIEPSFEKGICYGQLDVPIPNNYKEQHKGIMAKLPKVYDAVFSSPLIRCKLLAEQISTNVIFDDRLKEVNFGNWEGKKWDDINQIELNNWMENYIEIAPPNGESLTQLINRFSDFSTDLKKQNITTVLIVTHAGIIRSAMNLFNNISIDKIMMEKVEFGQIYKYDWSFPKNNSNIS